MLEQAAMVDEVVKGASNVTLSTEAEKSEGEKVVNLTKEKEATEKYLRRYFFCL